MRNKAIIAILGYILSVGFNIPHLVNIYILAGNTTMPEGYNWITMIVLDFGILVLALNNREHYATAFAWIIFVLNLYFYWYALPFPGEWSEWVATLPGLLFSIIPAFFISFFSELIAEIFREDFKSDRDQLASIRYILDDYSLLIDNNRQTIDIYRPLLESISKIKGCSIVVKGEQSVKGKVCKCGVVHKAGSNKAANFNCDNCGELIEW